MQPTCQYLSKFVGEQTKLDKNHVSSSPVLGCLHAAYTYTGLYKVSEGDARLLPLWAIVYAMAYRLLIGV